MRTSAFKPVPRNLERTPGSVFSSAINAWGNPAGQLGALSFPAMPKWAGYAVAAVALLAAYKRKVPMWAGLAGAGAAYWFLIRSASAAGGSNITAGTVVVSDGTSYVLTDASPGILSADGSTLTIAGTVYPVTSTGPGGFYYVDPPGTGAASLSSV